MIVRHFLHWVRTAGAAERADATSALARAYLHSNMSWDDRIAAEGAMLMLLDDPSPLVRYALAEALAASPHAPPPVIMALAADQADIAAVILTHSPILVDADLVDAVGGGDDAAQVAIANRRSVPCAVSAAIAEVGTPNACLVLLDNPGADLVPLSLDRIVERFGDVPLVREALLRRDDLPSATRHALVRKLSESLAAFVCQRRWLDDERARRVTHEACEKAAVAIAAEATPSEVRPLVRHLRDSGQLTAGLILRALLSGNVRLFEEALAELADVPIARVAAIVHDRRSSGFRSLYARATLPASAYPAFRAALEAMGEGGYISEPGGASRLKRRMVERVLTSCARELSGEIEPLLTLLRRFAMEAAREEARMFCDELVDSLDRRIERYAA